MPRRIRDNLERFLSRVVMAGDSECWLWQASLDGFGYGQFKWQDQSRGYRAHRFSAKYLGHLDITNQCVLHHCDRPRCVNPHHLFLGSRKDNYLDMVSKGRARIARPQPVETPLGVFPSILHASVSHGCSESMIIYLLAHKPQLYRRL